MKSETLREKKIFESHSSDTLNPNLKYKHSTLIFKHNSQRFHQNFFSNKGLRYHIYRYKKKKKPFMLKLFHYILSLIILILSFESKRLKFDVNLK